MVSRAAKGEPVSVYLFGTDTPLEEDGFEPLVPPSKRTAVPSSSLVFPCPAVPAAIVLISESDDVELRPPVRCQVSFDFGQVFQGPDSPVEQARCKLSVHLALVSLDSRRGKGSRDRLGVVPEMPFLSTGGPAVRIPLAPAASQQRNCTGGGLRWMTQSRRLVV